MPAGAAIIEGLAHDRLAVHPLGGVAADGFGFPRFQHFLRDLHVRGGLGFHRNAHGVAAGGRGEHFQVGAVHGAADADLAQLHAVAKIHDGDGVLRVLQLAGVAGDLIPCARHVIGHDVHKIHVGRHETPVLHGQRPAGGGGGAGGEPLHAGAVGVVHGLTELLGKGGKVGAVLLGRTPDGTALIFFAFGQARAVLTAAEIFPVNVEAVHPWVFLQNVQTALHEGGAALGGVGHFGEIAAAGPAADGDQNFDIRVLLGIILILGKVVPGQAGRHPARLVVVKIRLGEGGRHAEAGSGFPGRRQPVP